VRNRSRISISATLVSALLLGLGLTTPAHADSPCYSTVPVEFINEIPTTDTGTITDYGTCSGLVIVGPEITSIGKSAFDPTSDIHLRRLAPITAIDLSQSNVTSIGYGSFSNNMQLETVTLSSNLITIGISAFAGDQNIRSVTFPATLTTIGANAFAKSQITQINIPDSVTVIGEGAFSGNTALLSINIGSDLSSLPLDAIPRTFRGIVTVSSGNGFFTVGDDGNLYQKNDKKLQLTGYPGDSDRRKDGAKPPTENGVEGGSEGRGSRQDQRSIPDPTKESENNSDQNLPLGQDGIAGPPPMSESINSSAHGEIMRAAEIRESLEQRATVELKSILTSNAKPDLATFKAAGFEAVTEKIVNKISDELLQIPEAQRGDLNVIKDVILRVATVDKLSTPETARYIQPADLVAIRALSEDNPKKQTITYALKKLDPTRIDTYKELLAEIAKQEAIIKVRAEKIAAVQAKVAVRSAKR